MNTYYCHVCDKNFDLSRAIASQLDKENKDILCTVCQGDFVELVKECEEPDIDSQGNEFLSCKSEEEKKAENDDDWEDCKTSKSKSKKRKNSEAQ